MRETEELGMELLTEIEGRLDPETEGVTPIRDDQDGTWRDRLVGLTLSAETSRDCPGCGEWIAWSPVTNTPRGTWSRQHGCGMWDHPAEIRTTIDYDAVLESEKDRPEWVANRATELVERLHAVAVEYE